MYNGNRTSDKKQYFVLPIVMLLPKSAFCRENIFTGATAFVFKLAMWNDDIATNALLHLRKVSLNLATCSHCCLCVLCAGDLHVHGKASCTKASLWQKR